MGSSDDAEEGTRANGPSAPRLDLQQFLYHNSNGLRRSPRSTGPSTPERSAASPKTRAASDRVVKPSSSSRTNPAKSSPGKARRKTSGYAAPSRYAHLSPLVDILEPNLVLVFVGVNPGVSTAVAGHGYAHPTNHFWRLLHSSGLTPDRRLSPTEDRSLPALYSMGMTNIVSRPTKDQSELSRAEMVEGAGILEDKFRQWRPQAVCLVGKGIWEAVWRYKHGTSQKKTDFKWGWQDESENMGCCEGEKGESEGEPWKGAPVFVATSTSGQAATLKPAEKEAIWKPLGDWVQARRAERARS